MEPNTKMIECPAHEGKHVAILAQHGHKYAGVWECPKTGETGSCEHEEVHIEDIENRPTGSNSLVFSEEVYVCDNCEQVVEGSPAQDRSEALAEMAD